MTIQRVSPQEALRLVGEEGYTFVDVRSVPEFEAGHPAGAYNIPWAHAVNGTMQPNPDFLAVMSKRFPKDARLLLGCRSGGRSMRAAEALEAAGYTQLVDQRAGWDGARDAFGRVQEVGWSGAGLPTASGPDAERGYDAVK
ncbi:MAG: rhodanese-like domain-containing protein [Polyangiales bacterium]